MFFLFNVQCRNITLSNDPRCQLETVETTNREELVYFGRWKYNESLKQIVVLYFCRLITDLLYKGITAEVEYHQ